jgi:microcystin-dependent protein
MTLFKWSQTAAADATADSTINWAEGQAPSSVNDSARAMMAATAKYRDDMAGAVVTGGTSTAYTVSSYQGFTSYSTGLEIWFTPHVTNGNGPVTILVDNLAIEPLRTAPNTDLQAGMLIQGTPYGAVYNIIDNAWYLKSFFGNPYNVPPAAGMDYWAFTAPNSSFAFPAGQAISRTTYATLFGMVGTQYGSGDGLTTFNLPDKRGRVSAAVDNLNGGTRANRLTIATISTGGGGTGLGDTGGAQTEALAQANLPNVNFAVSGTASVQTTQSNVVFGNVTVIGAGSGAVERCMDGTGGSGTISSIGSISGTAASGGSGTPLITVQPTILCNYIMRIL